MSVRIEIADALVITQSGMSKAGKPYTIHKQEGYLHNGHKYPERFEFSPPVDGDNKPVPYAPGMYELAPASINVGEYKRLEIGGFDGLKLLAISDAKSK
jgi:hypothetical protein